MRKPTCARRGGTRRLAAAARRAVAETAERQCDIDRSCRNTLFGEYHARSLARGVTVRTRPRRGAGVGADAGALPRFINGSATHRGRRRCVRENGGGVPRRRRCRRAAGGGAVYIA